MGWGEREWGDYRQVWEILGMEDQHWAGNQQRQQTDNGSPSTRELAGKTRRRGHYGVVLTNGNGVNQKPEETCTSWTDLCQRGPNRVGKKAWNSHCDTQYLVGVGRGIGNVATRLMAGKHWDQGPAGEKNH